jgi:hypothetical protein
MAFERGIRRIGTEEAAQRLGGVSARRAREIMAEIERQEPSAVTTTLGGHRRVSIDALDRYAERQRKAAVERNRRNRREGRFLGRSTKNETGETGGMGSPQALTL